MIDLPVAPVLPAGSEWYCDQCGARYANPGVCTNQHPPAELKPIAGDVTLDAPRDEGFTVAGGTTTTPATVAKPLDAALTTDAVNVQHDAAGNVVPAGSTPTAVDAAGNVVPLQVGSPATQDAQNAALDRAITAIQDALRILTATRGA